MDNIFAALFRLEMETQNFLLFHKKINCIAFLDLFFGTDFEWTGTGRDTIDDNKRLADNSVFYGS